MNAKTNKSDESILQIRDSGRLRTITLNRPERKNALTPELHHLLGEAVNAAAKDPDVGALLLTGAGDAFCSGGDVKASAEQAKKAGRPETVEERADFLRLHANTARLLNQMPKPSIALVNGAAVGAGMALALACDIRIASRDAILRTGYAGIGLAGDLGIGYFLTRLVGYARACELLFLNNIIDMTSAGDMGLVNFVFPNDEVIAEGTAIAEKLAQGPTIAYRYMKQNITIADTGTLELVIDREAYNSARCVRTKDVKEAATAFREKRTPKFTGQ